MYFWVSCVVCSSIVTSFKNPAVGDGTKKRERVAQLLGLHDQSPLHLHRGLQQDVGGILVELHLRKEGLRPTPRTAKKEGLIREESSGSIKGVVCLGVQSFFLISVLFLRFLLCWDPVWWSVEVLVKHRFVSLVCFTSNQPPNQPTKLSPLVASLRACTASLSSSVAWGSACGPMNLLTFKTSFFVTGKYSSANKQFVNLGRTKSLADRCLSSLLSSLLSGSLLQPVPLRVSLSVFH